MNPRLRIAFVSPRFPEGATVGGAETLLKNLAVRAQAAGHDVSFLTTCATNHFSWDNEVPPGTRTINGVPVTFFPVDEDRDLEVFLHVQDRISARHAVSAEDEMAWLRNNVNSRPLCEHLQAEGERYDRVVIGPYLLGLTFFAARALPRKTLLVPCLHDEPFAYLQAFGEMFRSVRGFMFNTTPEMELAVRLFGVEPQRSRVVGMGLDPFEADPHAFAARRGLDAPYVLYSGRREPLKGTPLLFDYVDAFRRRTGHELTLVMTGTGEVEVPPSLAPHLLDVGFVSEQEKHEAMAGAAAFCHPSSNESLGIVLLESWLAGTAALVHAGSEVLTFQCRESDGGLWFRVYPEFEEELTLLMDRPDLRERLGRNGQEYVRTHYAWPAVLRRLEDALHKL